MSLEICLQTNSNKNMLTHEFDFQNAIVAKDYDGRPIYDFAKMINCLVIFENFEREEAEYFLQAKLENEYDGSKYVVLYRYE